MLCSTILIIATSDVFLALLFPREVGGSKIVVLKQFSRG